MAKLKLKVVLVPIQFSDVPSSNLDSSQSRRFLHLADADSDLGKVCDELTKRYAKLYPDDDKLAIMSLQDDDRCDLDPDFEAGEALNSGDIIRVIVENELQNLSNHTSFNQLLMMAADSTPAVMRLVDLNKQTQSTPIYPPAPVLTQDSTFPASSRKRTKEYFDLTDANIPSKHARRTVWSSRNESFIEPKVPAIPLTPQLNVSKKRKNHSSPPKTQNLDIEDINETNISLPPPDIGDDRSIPQKKSSSTKPKEEALPGKKRITSGMLSMPAHAQLEKEEILQPKLSKPGKHYLYSRALYSDMGGSETTSSDLDSDETSLDFKDKSLEIGVENISKDDEVEDRPLASLYEETIKNSSNIQEETLTKTEIMNLFKNGMKIPARLQNKSQNESARSRNLSALMKNLEIDMVDKNPVLSSEEKRATRAAANRKTRTALKKAQTSKIANPDSKDSNLMTSLSGSKKGSHLNGSHPKRSESKSPERKSSEPKNTEPKSSEPKSSEPKSSEPKSTEPNSIKSKISETKGSDPKSFDRKISDPKDSDPRHAIKYISNPSELLNSLKSISAFNKEVTSKNTNGVSSSHNNKTVSGPKDTRTKDSMKHIKNSDPNNNKKGKKSEAKHEVVDKIHLKEAAPSINTDSSNDIQLKEEIETNGQEIKPHCPSEGFQPSFTDLAGTSKLGALFEKMKQFDEKLNVLNKKGRYNTKQLSQRDSDNIESSSLHKDRIAEPQINTTKLISSPKNGTNTNKEIHSSPTKEEQTKNSVQVVKPQTSNESKNIQPEHNDVLPTTMQGQQIGNLGIYANLNSYPISYNNITSNSHLANNTSDKNNSSTLNNLLKVAETKNISNVNSPMSKSNKKDIPTTVNNLMSKANDSTSVTRNSISKRNDKEVPSTVNNTMSKANEKNTSNTVNNSISKSNDKDIPSTVNNLMSKADNKGNFNNLNSTIFKASDKSMSNMNKAMGENDMDTSNDISTTTNKTNDKTIPNYMGNTTGKPIHNNTSQNMNNVKDKVNYNDIHSNKPIAMSNPGILKKIIGETTSKISCLNDKTSNNDNVVLASINGATKITGINHIEDKVSDQGKSIVSSNIGQHVGVEYPYVKSNVTNGAEKTTEFLKSKYLPHSTPNDHRIQKRVQNVYSAPYDPSKLTNDKVNNFDFKKRNLSTNSSPPVSSSGNNIDTVVFSATNGYTNPRGFPNQENFQSLNLQRLETTRQDSNNARDNNSNSNPNNNVRTDGQVPPITKNTSNQLHRADKTNDSKLKDLFLRVDSKLPNSAETNTSSPEKLKSPSTPTKVSAPAKLAKIHGITLTNSSLSLNMAGSSRFAERRSKHPADYANVSSIAKQPNEHERIKLRAESIKSNPFILDVQPLHGGEALSKEDASKEAEDSTKQKKLGLNKRKHNRSYSNVSSSSSDESPSSESENNDSDIENKRPRLAAAVPSSTFSHPNVLHQSQSIFSPASKEKELLQTRKDDGSHPSATKVSQESPQKTPETPSSYQDKSNIKKPILTSLSDLALRGVPDVESTSTVDLVTKDIKKSKDETTDGETTDEVGSSSSSSATDSDDSDSDQDTSGKFINIKKLNKGKPKRNKGGFSALMKDARKF